MLVLSRKSGERLTIGDSVVITVVRVNGGQVRLGIEAPRSLAVLREELTCANPPAIPLVHRDFDPAQTLHNC